MRRLFLERRHVVWTPRSAKEFEYVLRGVEAGRDVHLLIDESNQWLRVQSGSETLLRMIRTARHAGLTVRLTTQYFSGDIPNAALEIESVYTVFQCVAPPALERFRKLGLSPDLLEKIPRLDRWESIRVEV